MKEYRIFLNVGTHPIYNSLIEFPPTGVKYINYLKKKPTNKLVIYERKRNIARRIITKLTSTLKLPRMLIFRTEAPLIHTSRGIIPLNKIPWVMDIEHAKSFFDDHKVLYNEMARKTVKKFLYSIYCKKLIPHCFMAKKSLIYHFGKELKKRIEVVYPAINAQKYKVKQNTETVKIFFVANKFFEKGGLEVLQSFKNLERKYDVKLFFKCRIPDNYRKKFQSKNILFIEKIIPYDKLLQKIYAKSNIFVFPSYIDTFGFALLEAMSVGLPLITTNIFAFPEIVENGKNGFMINAKKYDWSNENGVMRVKWLLKPESRMEMYSEEKKEIVRQLVEKLSLLIEDSSLRKRMGRYGRRMVEKGKFSIKERNKKLRVIYEEALKC